jgi:hypothetical protein
VDGHDQYKRLLKQYVDLNRWLAVAGSAGQDWVKVKKQLFDSMASMEALFTPEQRAYWERVRMVIDLFNGTIILESGHKQKREGRQWTHGQGVWRGFKRSGIARARTAGPGS